MRTLFRRPSQYSVPPTPVSQSLEDRLRQAERDLLEWTRLSEAAKAARQNADSLCRDDGSALFRLEDSELESRRKAAREAIGKADASAESLRSFEAEHGNEQAIQARLEQFYAERTRQEQAEVRRVVTAKLGTMLRLLDELYRVQRELDGIRKDARQRIGKEWSDCIPGMPPGFFPSENIGLSTSLLSGFKFVAGKWDRTLLASSDPVSQFLDREPWGQYLPFLSWH